MDRSAAMLQFDRRLDAISKLCITMLEHENGGTAVVLKKLSAELTPMVALLAADAVVDPDRTSPLLQRLMQASVLRELSAACLGDHPPGARCVLISTFSSILREVPQRVLLHTQNILTPLKKAIQSFVTPGGSPGGAVDVDATSRGGPTVSHACTAEEHLARVHLLNELCARFEGDPAVTGFFFDGDGFERHAAQRVRQTHDRDSVSPDGPGSLKVESSAGFFPLFSALTDYMHEAGPTGEVARGALLLCVAVANGEDTRVGEFVADHSPFCRLLVVWICARYSDLPSKLRGGPGHDWRLLGVTDDPKLQEYLRCLDFCEKVVSTSPQVVGRQLVTILSHGFVFPVLRPKLLQSGAAQAIAATAYLEIALRRIKRPELVAPFTLMVSMRGAPGTNDMAESSDGVEQVPEVLQTLLRRIMGPNPPLCLATLRLIHTLLQQGNEELFHEACMLKLITDASATAKVVPITGMHGTPCVVMIHAARELLALRSPPFESNPLGPNFHDYTADARFGVEARRASCSTWRERYDLQLLRDEVQRQPQSFVGGMLDGLQRAMLAGSSMRGDPASFGLWAALLMKLRTFLTQSAKLNLLLTQVITTLAQYTPPLWQCFVFSMSPNKKSGIVTLYETLSAIALDIRELEAKSIGGPAELATAVAAARESVQMQRPQPAEDNATLGSEGNRGSGVFDSGLTSRSPTPSSPRKPRTSKDAAGEPKIRNRVVNGVLLFEELLKELAAVALEQAVATPPHLLEHWDPK